MAEPQNGPSVNLRPAQRYYPITRALPSRVALCDVFIDVPGDPWAGTYCKLRAWHAGEHSAHYPERADADGGSNALNA